MAMILTRAAAGFHKPVSRVFPKTGRAVPCCGHSASMRLGFTAAMAYWRTLVRLRDCQTPSPPWIRHRIYLSSHTSSIRAPLKTLLTMIVNPFT